MLCGYGPALDQDADRSASASMTRAPSFLETGGRLPVSRGGYGGRRCLVDPGDLAMGSPRLESPSTQLKLFRGPEVQGGWAADSGPSLVEFFRDWIEPNVLQAAAAGTLVQYRESLRFWARHTGDPPLRQIDQATCTEFLAGIACHRGWRGGAISPNTIRKHCRGLQRCLDLAGPPTRENRLGQDLYGQQESGVRGQGSGLKAKPIPFLQLPHRRRKAAEDQFTLDELAGWLSAAERAQQPQLPHCSPCCWWQSLLLLLYNSGMRIGTALQLRWEWLKGDTLTIPAEAIKGHDDRRIFLNHHARAAIERLCPPSLAPGPSSLRPLTPSPLAPRPSPLAPARSPLIFPWPHSRRRLDRERIRMLKRAAINPIGHGFHALRKSLLTHLMNQDSAIAQMVAGHASIVTTLESYTHPRLARMMEIMEHVPQPDPVHADPQRRLF